MPLILLRGFAEMGNLDLPIRLIVPGTWDGGREQNAESTLTS